MKRGMKGFILFSILFSLVYTSSLAAQWEPIILYSWQNDILFQVTSEQGNPEPDPFNPGTFSGIRMFDGSRETCWAEGVPGGGRGEALFFRIPENTRALNFINGFASSDELFQAHNRVKNMRVSFYVGVSPEAHVSEIAVQFYAVRYEKEYIIELQDTQDEQVFNFPVSWTELRAFKEDVVDSYQNEKLMEVGSPADAVHYIIKLEIQDIYQGSGTDATCISEIGIEEYIQTVNDIYLSQDESAVLMDTEKTSGVEIDRDNEAVFQIINSSQDKQWLICIKMPKKSEGRVETEYVLYNTFIPQKIDKNILGECVSDMYGFVKREGKLFLEYFNSETSQIEYLDLDKIKIM